MLVIPESQFPFPEQSCRHKESAILEAVTSVLVVVSGTGNNETPRPVLPSRLENLLLPKPICSCFTMF